MLIESLLRTLGAHIRNKISFSLRCFVLKNFFFFTNDRKIQRGLLYVAETYYIVIIIIIIIITTIIIVRRRRIIICLREWCARAH